jgi:cysteinyl-tRNA synthetase
VLSEGKKLDDKSASLTLADLMNMGYSGRVIRFWLLSSHYRKPIPFSKERLDNAKRALERLDQCLLKLRSVKQGQPYAEREQLLYDLKTGFSSAMDDDLNISAALATIYTVVKKVNALILKKRLHAQDASKILEGFRSIDAVLNILNFFDDYFDPGIQRLLRQRDKARSEQNWGLADKIRDELKSRGILVQDQN